MSVRRLLTTSSAAGDVVYSANVFLLDTPTTDAAQVAVDRLAFPEGTGAGITARVAGDILVSSKDGHSIFLRRVVSVTDDGSHVVVATSPASVPDAVRQATLAYSLPATVAGAPTSSGAPTTPGHVQPFDNGPTGGIFGGKVDFALAEGWTCGLWNCQTSAGMKITPKVKSGYFTPAVSVSAQLDIFDNKLDLLRFVTTASLDADLKLALSIQNKGSFGAEGTVMETPEVPLLIGDIPTYLQGGIVVGTEGELYAPAVDVVLDGGFHADVSAGFEIDKNGTVTGIFNGGNFTPTFSHQVVGVGAEVRSRQYVAAKVSWLVGLPLDALDAGPSLTFRKYWQARWYADSMTGVYEENDTGHDITVTGTIRELGGFSQSLSLKLADVTDSSETTQFTGPFAVFPCESAKDGDYCGNESLSGFRLGVSGHLYHCAVSKVTSDTACPHGCGPATGVDAAQGKRVACEPATNNPCHSAADGNYCGNENVNGFDGGQLGLPASAQITCAGGNVSKELTCSGGCGPISGGARVGCFTPSSGPTTPCGAGDNNGPNNGTCGGDGRVYYCYQNAWHLKDDCIARSENCLVEPSGVADQCVSNGGTPMQGPSAACGAGNDDGPGNGTCGPDGRVYYCYQGVWHLKDDCLAKSESCVVEPNGVADICQASGRRLSPPTAGCGAGDNDGANNGTCGPDGRVYYCYQGSWNLKDDCVARSVACVVEAAGVADHCTSGCTTGAECGRGEQCTGGRCSCAGPVCAGSCCGADAWCGSGSRCCTGCSPGCPC